MEELNKISPISTKTIKNNSNSNLQGFIWALLSSIFQTEVIEDVLYILKNTILSEQLDTVPINNIHKTGLVGLSTKHMKKFMVEFLFELNYSRAENKVDLKLNKNPIILDIFVLLFRKLLVTLNVEAENFDKPIPSV